jgi:hypothetical protein
MPDIVERLRNVSKVELHEPLCMEAANEIEQLRQKNAKLVETLQSIAAIEHAHIPAPTTPAEANLWGIIEGCVRVAKKALGKE